MTSTSRHIVVGVDGSASSVDALKWAVAQAALIGGTVQAVIAWEYPKMYGGYPMTDGLDWRSNAQQTVDTALHALGEDGANISSTVIEGHPARVLLDASQGAELLVVGNRGHGGFTGMLLGSVSEHVIAHATCPVLVLRHAAGS